MGLLLLLLERGMVVSSWSSQHMVLPRLVGGFRMVTDPCAVLYACVATPGGSLHV